MAEKRPNRGTKARRPRADQAGERYAPAQRLHQLRAMLGSAGGVSVYAIAERFGVSVRTAIRYLRALEAAGEPLFHDTVGKQRLWRLHPSARKESIALTTDQVVTLFLSRRTFDFLKGTGFAESLEEIFDKLEATLRRREFDTKNLERKLFDVNEAPHVYEGRFDHMNDILTALLREDRLELTRDRSKPFLFEPYTLLVYKKGLYLVGYSHHHQSVRMFALDSIRDAEWLKDERFEYPKDYHPSQLVEGNFGLIGGERPTRVRLLFDAEAARYLERRLWHPSQVVTKSDRGVEMTMLVSGTTELKTWILGWGDRVEVLEPATLRDQVAAEHARAAGRYGPSS